MPKSEQGVNADRYRIIPRTLIFLTHGEEVLLIKGAPNKRLWAGRYNGIGGHIERGEDILSSARRELFEETGLTTSRLWLCGVVMVDASDPIGIGVFLFRGEFEGGALINSREGELSWIHPEDLENLPLVEDLPVLLPKVLALKPGDPPIAALTDYDDQDRLRIRLA